MLPFVEPSKEGAGPPLDAFDSSQPLSMRALGKQLEDLLLDPRTWARGELDQGAPSPSA